MRSLVLVAAILSVPASVAVAQATDISGTWSTQTEVQGIAVNETCVLKQAADGKLTGNCDTSGGKFDVTGAVKGKRVTFTHPAMYAGQDMTVSFFGTVNDESNIAGSIDMQPINAGGAFAMKKQSK